MLLRLSNEENRVWLVQKRDQLATESTQEKDHAGSGRLKIETVGDILGLDTL